MVSVCHATYQELMTKESSNFISGSCLRKVIVLPSLVVIDIVVLEI